MELPLHTVPFVSKRTEKTADEGHCAMKDHYSCFITMYSTICCCCCYWRLHGASVLNTCLPLLRSRICVSATPCGFCGGQNGVWVGFCLGLSVFPCHKFLSTISPHTSHSFRFISFHFIRPCDGATGVVGRHPSYSLTYNIGDFIASHPSTRPCVGHELRIFIYL